MPFRIFFLLYLAFIASAYSMESICAPGFEVIGLNADFGKSSVEALQNKMKTQADARQLVVPSEENYIAATNNINNQINWAKSSNCSYLLQTTLTQLEKNIRINARVMDLKTGDYVFENAYEAKTADYLPTVFVQLGNTLLHPEFKETEMENAAETISKNQFGTSVTLLSSKNLGFIYDSRFLLLMDIKTFWIELFLSMKMSFKEDDLFLYYDPGVRILYPFSDKPNTFYIGSGGGFSWKTDDYGYDNSYGAFVENSLGYYFIWRKLPMRIEAVATAMFHEEKSMGGGLRIIVGFLTDAPKKNLDSLDSRDTIPKEQVEKIEEIKNVEETKPDEKKYFRARFAYNTFYLPNSEKGSGITGGITADVPISKNMSLEPGLIFGMRTLTLNNVYHYDDGYDHYYDSKLKESVISIPALLKIMLFGGPRFYIEGGVQLDFPFPGDYRDFENWSYDSRSTFDFGLAYGFGWHLGKNYSFGFRGVKGLTNFDNAKGFRGKPVQFELGVYGALGFIPVLLLAILN